MCARPIGSDPESSIPLTARLAFKYGTSQWYRFDSPDADAAVKAQYIRRNAFDGNQPSWIVLSLQVPLGDPARPTDPLMARISLTETKINWYRYDCRDGDSLIKAVYVRKTSLTAKPPQWLVLTIRLSKTFSAPELART